MADARPGRGLPAPGRPGRVVRARRRIVGAAVLAVLLAVAAAALALGAPAVDGTAEIKGYGAISSSGNATPASASSTGAGQGSAGGAVSTPAGPAGSVQVEVTASGDGPAARAEGTVLVHNVNLLDGRIIASSLTMSVIAAAGPNGVEAGLSAASAPALNIDGVGVSASPGSRHPVPGVGTLVMFEQVSDGAGRVRANALRLEVSEPGAPPVGEVVIGHLDAVAMAGQAATPEPEPEPEPEPGPERPATTPSTGTTPEPPPSGREDRTGTGDDGGDRDPGAATRTAPEPAPREPAPQREPAPRSEPAVPASDPTPPVALGLPRMDAPLIPPNDADYVFPVVGEASFTDDYGAPRPGTGWHHGNDIFAPTGTPVAAVADGTLFQVGVNTLGGNRLWLRDEAGNEFYYAHLSAYAREAVDGARVQAGQVIAFVGNTGQAITTPPHLHFEIHPGGGDSVNPYPYLLAWDRGADVPRAFLAAADAPPGTGGAPAGGATLVGIEPALDAPPAVGDGLAGVAG